MHEIISFLKAAVDRTELAGVNGCYVIRGGHIYCRNVRMQAGVAMESGVDFNVPAAALDAALARMKSIDALNVEEGFVTVKSGRMRSKIKLNPDEPSPLPEQPEDWWDCPPGLAEALKLALPHVGEMGWQECVRLMTGRVTAFCPQSGVDMAVKGLEFQSPILLTRDVVEFIVAQGAPAEYAPEENAVTFRWPDGRWLRSQLYVGEMAEGNIARLFEEAGTKAPIAIDAGFKEAYTDAAAMTDSAVMMTPEGFTGIKGDGVAVSTVEYPIKGLPQDHRSYWSTKHMDNMVAQAEVWNPLAWPNPCFFKAHNMRGIIMGRSRW